MYTVKSKSVNMDNSKLLEIALMETVVRIIPAILHELNNKMTAVSGYAELMLTEKDKSEQMTSDLLNLQDAAREGEKLISMMSNLSADTQENCHSHYNPEAAIADVITLLGKLIRNKNITIGFAPSRMFGKAMGSQNGFMLGMVVLLVNMIESMPRGGRIRIESERSPLNTILISITTAHKGFKELDVPEHVEPFSKSLFTSEFLKEMCNSAFVRLGMRLAKSEDEEGCACYSIELPVADMKNTESFMRDLDLKHSMSGWKIKMGSKV